MSDPPASLLQEGFLIGERQVRPREGQVGSPGSCVRVEPRAMAVLVHLAGAGGRVVSREEIVSSIWGHAHVTDDALTRCISQLRKALGDDRRQPRFLETIPKRGYRLLAKVSPLRKEGLSRVPRSPTLLVLPFQKLSTRDDDEYVADGVTELLITRLAALPALTVISRTTAMHYRHSDRPLPEIAADVGATHVIEGSVLRSAEQLQVVVQLIDAATDTHVWASSYTRPFGDLLALENEISQALAVELHARLRPAEQRRLAAPPALAPHVLRDYLKGRYFLARRSDRDIRAAIGYFESVLREQADFAPALAGIAESWTLLAHYGAEPPSAAFEQARIAAEQALTADAECAEANAAMAAIAMFYDWNFDTAEAYVQRALELSPGYPMSHLVHGNLCAIRADFVAAQNSLGEALRVDPLNPGLNMNLGDYLMLERRHAEAVTALERTLELVPGSAPARYRLVLAHALSGDHDESGRELALLADDADAARRAEHAAIIAGLAGRRGEAQAAVAELLRLQGERPVSPWAAVRATAAAGDIEQAFEWLDKAIEQRSSSAIFLAVAPLLDSLRGDPRFASRLQRVGLS